MLAASGPNALDLDQMSAQELLDELAGLSGSWALAILRCYSSPLRNSGPAPDVAPERPNSTPNTSVHGLETLSEEEARA